MHELRPVAAAATPPRPVKRKIRKRLQALERRVAELEARPFEPPPKPDPVSEPVVVDWLWRDTVADYATYIDDEGWSVGGYL